MKNWVEMHEQEEIEESHARRRGNDNSVGEGSPSDPGELPSNGNGLRPLKYWEPKELRERHRIAIRLHACGMTNNRIAETLGYTPSRISIILNDPRAEAVRMEMSSLVTDNLDNIGLRLQFYAGEALTEVVDLMRGADSEGVRQKSAFDILDRAGYNKIEKHISATTNIPEDKVAQLLGTLEETKKIFNADYTIED